MLFNRLNAPASGVDVEQMIAGLPEALDAEALEQAWRLVVERHAALRTSFFWGGPGEPDQRVAPEVSVPFVVHDWRQASLAERDQRLEAFLADDRRLGFDLSRPPLLRLALFRRGDADYQLVWTFFHGILDGGSFVAIVNEVFATYEALRRGERPTAPPPPPSYRAHIDWLQGELAAKAEAARAYWSARLEGFVAPNVLTSPRTDAGAAPGYGERAFRLSRAETDRLKASGKIHDLTLNTFVQGAWALVLAASTGDDDVVFGATRGCRRTSLAGAEDIAGVFINTLPLRLTMDATATASAWLGGVRDQHREVRPFEHTPLADVLKASALGGDQALFETIIVFNERLMEAAMQAQGRRLEPNARSAGSSRRTSRSRCSATPRTSSCSSSRTIARASRMTPPRGSPSASRPMMKALAANLEVTLAELPTLASDERALVVERWNGTAVALPQRGRGGARLVHELFERQAAATPDAVAAIIYRGRAPDLPAARRARPVPGAHAAGRAASGPTPSSGCASIARSRWSSASSAS